MSTPKRNLAPSLLSCDMTELGKEVESVLACGAERLHFDFKDGIFTSDFGFGFQAMSVIKKKFPNAFLDVHLMIHYPDRWLTFLIMVGANQITIHPDCELDMSLSDTLVKIRNGKGCPTRVGLAINAATPYEEIADVVYLCDVILVTTDVPGYFDQVPTAIDKIRQIREKHPKIDIQIDGKVDTETASLAVRAGANVLSPRRALFELESQAEREKFCNHLKNCT